MRWRNIAPDCMGGEWPERVVRGRRTRERGRTDLFAPIRARSPGRSGPGLPRRSQVERLSRGIRRVPSVRSFNPLQGNLSVPRRPGGRAGSTIGPGQRVLGRRPPVAGRRPGTGRPTVLRCENLARRFRLDRASEDGNDFITGLTGAHVVRFLLQEISRVSVGAAKGRVAELRSLLRFLYLTCRTPVPLAIAVPPVAGWHDVGVPVAVTASDVQRLLDSCDRSTPIGMRDFAILMLVARLGLRSAEEARLELADIDWRAGDRRPRGSRQGMPAGPPSVAVRRGRGSECEYLIKARPTTPAVHHQRRPH